MAEDLVEAKKPEGSDGDPQEFHPAHKFFSPSSNGAFYLETLNPDSETPRPSACNRDPPAVSAPSLARRSDGVEVYQHEMDPELSSRIRFPKIGAGLANLGNTCFLNAVLQCLTYTEPFAAYLQSGKHQISCQIAGFCAMCAIQNHVMIALQSTGKILSPSTLVKNLRCISHNFHNSRQEDAHESQVMCMQCSYSSNKFDPFLDLSLEIAKVDSLWKALNYFTAVEQLDGGERQYQCQNCKENVRGLKQLTIHKAPYVLTIHLKRFDSFVPGQKIDTKVDFELTLDLKPFISDPHEGDLKYTLYGVLVHAGWSTESGHYYCYVCTSSGMWHSLDDNQVYQVSEKTVLEQKAYMLFYVRDRSSIVKKSSEMVQKDCISTNPPVKKLIPHSALVIKGAVLNCLVDGKLSTLESSSAILSRSKCTSSDSQLPGVAFLQENDNNVQKEDVAPQSDSQLLGREAALLRANSDILSNVLQQGKKSADAASSKEFMMPVAQIIQQRLIEDSIEPAQDKDFVVMVTHVNDATVTSESDQTNSGKCLLSNDCDEEVKSDMLLSVPNNASCSDSSPQQHHEKILKQINKMRENDDVAIAIYQNNDALSKKGTSNVPADKNPLKLLNQSRFMQMASHDTTSVEHQIGNESKRCSTNIKCNGGYLKLEESGITNILEGSSGGFVEKEVLDIMKSQTGLKPKKPAKHSLNGIYFGRKQLFLSLLSADKIRKRNRRKKRLSIMTSLHKKAVPDDVSMNDQGTSTSETVKNVVLSECSGRKHSRASFKKNRSTRRMRNDSYCNGNSLTVSTGGIVGDNGKDQTHDHPEQSRWCSTSSTDYQCNSRDTILDDNGLLQCNIMKLLMRGLNQKTVARWYHLESPEFVDRLESSRSSRIDYVLDEWNEEYCQGRRKKAKKSIESNGAQNVFQEMTNVKEQERLEVKKQSQTRTEEIMVQLSSVRFPSPYSFGL
ncbi:hypothetical protein OPV22_022043 [Ensete ventricosum]|uniref:Ubiquitin carboxyl-terminal hydrolase n=1 Tax=Ensete ventricosum TaxID=4639 RepID=A0AAV8QIK1_ENSVE|nr:hypothetical protein OPV22_022043 [Ensete ventricosum]